MSFQYYPTPAKTAAIMWSKFKRAIGVVCDPSAGMGHLLSHAQEGFEELADTDIPWLAETPDEEFVQGRFRVRFREQARYKFKQDRNGFLAVEIDPQRHARLRELGGTVIGYDFMSIESLATVDQVIMNPPFADGARHVVHAWKCVYDAEIVAIVNAETVRNPYSQERRILVDLIEKHGSVEFLQDQFVGDDVERETGVEIALIYLSKEPANIIDMDSILGSLKKGDNSLGPEIDAEISTALAIPENLVGNTYRRFVIATEAARKAAEINAVAAKASNDLGLTLEQMQTLGVGNDVRETNVSMRKAANEGFRIRHKDLKKAAWAQIIRSSLLTNKLSNQARRKVESEAETIYQLEFSVANVHGFLAGLYHSMGDIYADMVCGLLDTIIGRSSDNVAFYKSWKSNERHRFGMRIRRTRFIIPNFSVTWGGSLCYESEQFLSDIDKVFGYLHGVSQPYDGLVDGFKSGRSNTSQRIQTRYFDFRFYPVAGTMHFYPKSQEIVEKLNRFVGARRQWLPNQMDDANADFSKQYDEAEKLTKEYDAAWKATGQSRGYNSPVYAASRDVQAEEHQATCQTMSDCINKVHEKLGLHCGPALTAAPKMAQLPMPAPIAQESGMQFDLLAA